MKDKMAARKHRKNLVRKEKLASKAIKLDLEKQLTDAQIEKVMEQTDAVENIRRLSLLNWLSDLGYSSPKKMQFKGKAAFVKDKKYYILDKLNLTEELVAALQDDAGKFVGLYALTELDDKKNGMIFQVIYVEKENDYVFKIHMTGEDMNNQTKKSK